MNPALATAATLAGAALVLATAASAVSTVSTLVVPRRLRSRIGRLVAAVVEAVHRLITPQRLQPARDRGDLDEGAVMDAFYLSWERWAAEVAESHTNYPVLTRFRSPGEGQPGSHPAQPLRRRPGVAGVTPAVLGRASTRRGDRGSC